MLYNKELGITEEDVQREENLDVLTEWRISLGSQISSICASKADKRDLSDNAKKLLKYKRAMMKIVNIKIKAVKIKNGWISERNKKKERTLSMLFMKHAKKHLPSSEYNKILALAKTEAEI